MIHRFADFEVDEERREFRLRGREIPVEPRVLDLLSYLICNRDRVVKKDELLQALWPGTVVVDGALQRVVSLARSALQRGGKRDAIRTYARHGYRFCAALDEEPAPVPPESSESIPASLAAARRAYLDHDWNAAVAAFEAADAGSALKAADLERWAQAAQWLGDSKAALEPLERAVAAHLSQRDRLGAARAAIQLAQIFFERLDLAVAVGWHRRAESFLQAQDDCRERGLSSCLSARIALFEGELEKALDAAEKTHRLGVALEDPDLEALGLLYSGHALLSLGDTVRGTDHQNEAAAAVLTGEISPWIGSVIYCGVIWACRNRADWSRAAQWTEQFKRWCDRHGLAAFPGTCRLHRAEVLSIHGELAEAEEEIKASTALLSNWAPWAEGDAYRVLGDLRLTRHELDGAEEAYGRARELGWDPQPGHAMLLLARGQADAAMRTLEASLADRNWANRERRGLLLAHFVLAAAAAGRTKRARAALEELVGRPDVSASPALQALAHAARAELEQREGRTAASMSELRGALGIWREVGSRLNAAHLQLRLAELLIEAGDREGARIELQSAAEAFRKARAHAPADRCRRLLASIATP